MKPGTRADLGDLTIAFLIGAGLGVAATLLLRAGPATRKPSGLATRIRHLRSLDRDIRNALAALRSH